MVGVRPLLDPTGVHCLGCSRCANGSKDYVRRDTRLDPRFFCHVKKKTHIDEGMKSANTAVMLTVFSCSSAID